MRRAVGFLFLASVFAWALISAMGVVKYPVFGHVHPCKWPGAIAYLIFLPLTAIAWSMAFPRRQAAPTNRSPRQDANLSVDPTTPETDDRLARIFRDCYSDFKALVPDVTSPFTDTILKMPPVEVPKYLVERDKFIRALNAAYVLCAAQARRSSFMSGDPLVHGLIDSYSTEAAGWKALDAFVVAGLLTAQQNEEILSRSEQAREGLFDATLRELADGNQTPFLTMHRYLEHDWAADIDEMNAKYGEITDVHSQRIGHLFLERRFSP